MKIANIQTKNFIHNNNVSFKNKANMITPDVKPQNKNNTTSLLLEAAGVIAIAGIYGITRGRSNTYIDELAKGLSEYTHKKIKSEQLQSVMSPKEFLSEISKLKEENFVSSPENIEKGIFCADLHSHTNFSDGQGEISSILTDVADYADKLYSKTNKKFIFALTDHDGVKGVKEALKIIAEEPQKFRNVKFVPGAELSFMLKSEIGSAKNNKCHNPIEGSELLAYCINPFSKNVNNYFENLYQKRANMVKTTISEISKKYSDVPFSEEDAFKFIHDKKDYIFAYNSHWKIYNYVQLQNRAVKIAKEQNKPQDFFTSVIKEHKIKTPYDFDNYLKNQNIHTQIPIIDESLSNFSKTFFPKIENEKIVAPSENTFEEIIDAFSKENGVILGFAHPAFLVENMTSSTIQKNIQYYINNSKNMLKLTEKYHQAYEEPVQHNSITWDFIHQANKILDEFGLISIGGRDSHKAKFL